METHILVSYIFGQAGLSGGPGAGVGNLMLVSGGNVLLVGGGVILLH